MPRKIAFTIKQNRLTHKRQPVSKLCSLGTVSGG